MHRMHKIMAVVMLMLPLAAAAQEAVTTRAVSVRAGPDSTYPLVATLAPGTAVSVGGCIAAYTWCDVYTGDVRGFVYSSYLNYPYQSYQVPIYSYGPALGLPIIVFSLGSYWDNYYRGRPFYSRRSYWAARPWHEPPSRFGRDWHPPAYHGNERRGPVTHGPAVRAPAGRPQAYRPPEHGGPSHPQQGHPQERRAPEPHPQGRAPEPRGGQAPHNQGGGGHNEGGRNEPKKGEAH